MQNNAITFESLFNRNFSDAENTEFLKEITERHPYFSPSQFFLLHRFKEDSGQFEKQAVKTNIFFNNPHWLNFQLQQTDPEVPVQQITPATEIKTIEPILVADPMEEIIDGSPDNTDATEEMEKEIEPVLVAAPIEEIIDESPDNTDATEEMEKEIEPMKIELKMPEEKTNLDEAMLFEPMHMVDYFASQGIKLTEEVQTADKLGKQLKSFTEWLKTMKKVHVENETEITVQTDQSINTLAENSNAETEVLTESMAEVFAKQGKIAKAGEVYQKLSLLNPAKSTYFAAKIENLKGS